MGITFRSLGEHVLSVIALRSCGVGLRAPFAVSAVLLVASCRREPVQLSLEAMDTVMVPDSFRVTRAIIVDKDAFVLSGYHARRVLFVRGDRVAQIGSPTLFAPAFMHAPTLAARNFAR